MMNVENLKSKQENGKTLYFYAGLGWVTEERLNQPDVAKNEAIKDFDCNPENSHCCADCPHNRNFSDWQDRLPCGQYHCWVLVKTDAPHECNKLKSVKGVSKATVKTIKGFYDGVNRKIV